MERDRLPGKLLKGVKRMTSTTTGALDHLAHNDKDAARGHRVHVTGAWDGDGEESALVIRVPLRDLNQAHEGGGQRRGWGFSLQVDFEYQGVPCALRTPWVALKKR